MDDPAKVMIAVAFFATISYGIRATTGALASRSRDRSPRMLGDDAEARLARIENVVEAMSVEVERIGEGQRFTTKLLSERGARAEIAAPDQPGAVNVRRGGPL